MIIAGALGPIVTEAGCTLVGLAADRDTAIALIHSSEIDLALIDLRLLDGWTGGDVARAAKENGVAVVFTTANRSLCPADIAIGLIEKPYPADGVAAALRYVAAQLSGARTGARPKCLASPPAATAPRQRSMSDAANAMR